jgi:hypothetical protein
MALIQSFNTGFGALLVRSLSQMGQFASPLPVARKC